MPFYYVLEAFTSSKGCVGEVDFLPLNMNFIHFIFIMKIIYGWDEWKLPLKWFAEFLVKKLDKAFYSNSP